MEFKLGGDEICEIAEGFGGIQNLDWWKRVSFVYSNVPQTLESERFGKGKSRRIMVLVIENVRFS